MSDLGADQAEVRVERLCRHYVQGDARLQVLDALSFTLHAGETVALLGRSGSGKSTLLNLISGIDSADDGRVIVAGQDLMALDERRRTLFRRRHIGFVYQSFNLLPSLSAVENIALVLELNGSGAATALLEAQAMLDSIGLGDKAASWPAQLSGGEQQRIAILRALANRPQLVLADEPTGNLDAVSGGNMLAFLRARQRESGSTLLLVTHSLAVAQSADRILTLEQGRVEERSGDFAW